MSKEQENYVKMLEEAVNYPGPGGPIAYWDSKSGKKIPFTSDDDLSDIVSKVAGDPQGTKTGSQVKDARDSAPDKNNRQDTMWDNNAKPEDRQLWEDSPMNQLEDEEEISLTEVESEVINRLIQEMDEGEDEGEDDMAGLDLDDLESGESEDDLDLEDLGLGDEEELDLDDIDVEDEDED